VNYASFLKTKLEDRDAAILVAEAHGDVIGYAYAAVLKIDEWDRMIDVNIKGVLYGIAAALPYMKEQKPGHIINVSSVAGDKVGPGFAVCAATKFAVRALSEGVRQEVKPYNIRTTVISRGAVATELLNSITEPDVAGTPTWIWSVAVDDALYVRGYNGQNSRWYQAAVRQ
jgi:NADP-dependent 3-hydroxy acid dehydrogenase YdfG